MGIIAKIRPSRAEGRRVIIGEAFLSSLNFLF